MGRRRVLALLAGAVALWPPIALGQSVGRLRNIGVLMGLAETDPEVLRRVAIFRQALQDLGWTEGHNIRIHYRSAIEADGLRALGNELLALQPDVIVAANSIVASTLLRETRTIPIVFVTASDPIGDGFVANLAQPNRNATGFTGNLASFCGKWLELLQEIAPGTTHFTALFNPNSAPAGGTYFLPSLQTAAASMSLGLDVALLREPTDIESVLAARAPVGGIIVLPDQFTCAHRESIVEAAARYRVPAIYPFRSFADAGGLISYGIDVPDLYRRVPSYVHRILNGARPADLPVLSPAKIELVINRRAAGMLGLTVPRIMLARADEVIE
ncbi:MAG TPA: ABC transporter substrate-binding protein [Xanthobacteraceae bacterium]|nr:ABC transporter substrate-binding protein [Xanthobacteraceae bacterium]